MSRECREHAWAVGRQMLNFPLDHKTSERRDHDGDMGTAAKQDLEKLT